ncbi:MAG: FHA domain-containing protein [Lachnospiraceae bacterium]|nr:FHA domain-containing protein [Lachnospiraceae bacterium]
MVVDLREDINNKYLVIKIGAGSDSYELKMLEHNKVDMICPMSVREINDEMFVYYDISGKVSLESRVENEKLTLDLIEKLVAEIKKLKEQLYQYMIDADRIMIDPKYIYFEKADNKFQYCCNFDKQEGGVASLRQLANFFIENADHSDRETVIMAYGLQQYVNSNEDITIEKISEYIYSNKKNSVDIPSDGEETDFYSESGLCEKNNSVRNDENIDDSLFCGESGKAQERETKNIIEMFFDKLFKKSDRYVTSDEMMCMVSEEEVNYGEQKNQMPEEIEEIEETVLLRSNVLQIGVVLKSTDVESMETIIPNTYPCIIGKSKKSADYIIDDKAVSRVHLKIEQTEEGFAIEDLNSTNRTYLNGEILPPHVLTEIKIGDLIGIADKEYVVC